MMVDGGLPMRGNDLTSFSPHMPNVSYGAVTNLQLGQHEVMVAPGAPAPPKISYVLV
jgi:hypothetical protein